MSTSALPSENASEPKRWLARPLFGRITPALVLLALILLLSLSLHFYNIQSIGDGNAYYTAAVKSMLQSWRNFFFVAAEPGGSVTVDKPPLGFWIQAAFAAVLGVSGFSVTLPNIIAGVLSVLVLYHLVKKYFGEAAGLSAALVLALTPVSLAVDRNNTIDGMLVLVLLLAAWAFLKAAETGRLRFLLFGAFLVGLGFNIKMLQAFLPLPAFYALYLFGAKRGWGRKILNLALASALLAVVSLAWPVAVDLTPGAERPYVGSTRTNSELELIFGYNGVNRLLGMMNRGRTFARNVFDENPANANPRENLDPPNVPGYSNPPSNQPQGANPQENINPPNVNGPPAYGPPGGNPRQSAGAPGMMGETGQAGVLRFFQAPMAKEMSWLLPFALLAVVPAAIFRRIRLPFIANEHHGYILWGGWLLTCLVFFSVAGFFHNYYLATLSPALGALVGIGVYGFERVRERSLVWSGLGMLAGAGVTLAFQLYLTAQFGLDEAWGWAAGGALGLACLAWLASLLWKPRRDLFVRLFGVLAVLSLLVIPGVWSVRTVASGTSNSLPAAYTGDYDNARGPGDNSTGQRQGFGSGGISVELLVYLQAHTRDVEYLVAVSSAQTGSGMVLETGRPVLFMGGFNGSDPVVDAGDLAQLVAEGRLRYILYGGDQRSGTGANSDIEAWLKENCQVVSDFGGGQALAGRGNAGSTLYECGN